MHLTLVIGCWQTVFKRLRAAGAYMLMTVPITVSATVLQAPLLWTYKAQYAVLSSGGSYTAWANKVNRDVRTTLLMGP